MLDEEARASAPGEFVQLSDGIVHYELAGPSSRQTVALVHGFSTPYYIWDPTFEALTEAGFRVLRYDLYGRGYSDRPATAYDRDLFDRQLLSLLSALDIDPPVDLIGLSMGGPVSVVFADRHPGLVRKLCLIDPAGFPQKQRALAKLIQAPVLGEILMSLFGDRMLVSSLTDDLYRPEGFPEYQEQYRPQMKYRGFKRALLSTLRNGLLGDITEIYERVGRQKRAVLLIWGREDEVVPFAVSEKAREAMPHAEFHAIDEAGHIPHYERPEVLNPLLIRFLRR